MGLNFAGLQMNILGILSMKQNFVLEKKTSFLLCFGL